jgi:hypothetical protein
MSFILGGGGPKIDQAAKARADKAANEQRQLIAQQREQLALDKKARTDREKAETEARRRRLRGFASLTSGGFRGFALGERETLG